jgi:hypothetical protein
MHMVLAIFGYLYMISDYFQVILAAFFELLAFCSLTMPLFLPTYDCLAFLFHFQDMAGSTRDSAG